MTRALTLALVTLLIGCEGTPAPVPPRADAAAASDEPRSPLTDRVWMRSDSTGMPGAMRVFLSDGTLLLDSCWETYRLERWTLEADSAIRWSEDGRNIRASIVSLADDGLVLRVNGESQPYEAASVPYLCPDMVR